MRAKVRISIVTYNSDKVFRVLDNLIEEFKSDSLCAFSIYDNHSDEAFIEKLKCYETFADITYGDANNGYGFGHNANLLKAQEDYFLVFNPDILLKKNDLERMLEVLEKEQDAAMLSPRIVSVDGSTQHLVRSRFTIFDLVVRRFPMKAVRSFFAERIADYENVHLPVDRTSYINIGSGCFMLIKSPIFKKLSGFDERFFMYLEDYDLCIRMNQISKIVYMPQVSVVHFWERGSGKNFKLARIHLQSVFRFFNKWGWKWF